jgi:hypothetical protein
LQPDSRRLTHNLHAKSCVDRTRYSNFAPHNGTRYPEVALFVSLHTSERLTMQIQAALMIKSPKNYQCYVTGVILVESLEEMNNQIQTTNEIRASKDIKIPANMVRDIFSSDHNDVFVQFTKGFLERMGLYVHSTERVKVIVDRYYVYIQNTGGELLVDSTSLGTPVEEKGSPALGGLDNAIYWISNKQVKQKITKRVAWNLNSKLSELGLTADDILKAFKQWGLEDPRTIYYVLEGTQSLSVEAFAVLYTEYGITSDDLFKGVGNEINEDSQPLSPKPSGALAEVIGDIVSQRHREIGTGSEDITNILVTILKDLNKLLTNCPAEQLQDLFDGIVAVTKQPKHASTIIGSLTDLVTKVKETRSISLDDILGHWQVIKEMIKLMRNRSPGQNPPT